MYLNNQILENKQDFEGRVDELYLQIANIIKVYNKRIDILNAQITTNDKIYNNYINKLNNQIQDKEELYSEKIDELNNEIIQKENLYNDKIDDLNNEFLEKENVYNEKIEALKEQLEDLNEKQQSMEDIPEYNNENKIINLGRFFNNKRNNKRVFSINEPISYYDLERLATDVIYLNEDDTSYMDHLAK